MADLHPTLTVYADSDTDRVMLGRMIEVMARLNGITVAIELHTPPPTARGES